MSDTAILLCGHGSREPGAAEEFQRIAAGLRLRLSPHVVATGYLEFTRPTIAEALVQLAAGGARRILVLPAMLFGAGHVQNDLPGEIACFRTVCPDVQVRLGRDLSLDDNLLNAAAERIAAAIPVPRQDSLLIVVGRGSSDAAANANIGKLAQFLRERLGFGRAEPAFSGVAHPRADAAMGAAAKLGFPRVVVFPYLLLTGVLVKRVYAQTDAAAASFPELEFIKAGYLGDHPLVVDALAERAFDLLDWAKPQADDGAL